MRTDGTGARRHCCLETKVTTVVEILIRDVHTWNLGADYSYVTNELKLMFSVICILTYIIECNYL